MADYDRDAYSRQFARLLNKALKRGRGDSRKALAWLEKGHKSFWALTFSRQRAERADAYLDVREHIVKRIEREDEG